MNTKHYSTSRNISHPIQEFVPPDTIFILILRDIEDDCSFQLPVLGYLTPKKAWRISSKLFFLPQYLQANHAPVHVKKIYTSNLAFSFKQQLYLQDERRAFMNDPAVSK